MGCRLSGPWMGEVPGVSTRDLSYIRKREALRILASYEQPITVQIEGRRGRSLQYHRTSDTSTQTERPWEQLHPVTADRPCYSHMTLPGNHGDGGRCDYLPNVPRDLENMRRVPRQELTSRAAQGQNCLIGCCNTNMEEPSSYHSQTEDEDYMLEKTVGYLPLHHELDSGLGWTDGSFHQGELSGMETEEGLDECHAHQGGKGVRGRGGSPSSESFISSELSDSGFYSVSTAEFLRFQRLLEKRMRIYNSRLHHQGEMQNLCMEGQKAHRELEAIPEALAMQVESDCAEMEDNPQRMVRVSSVQLHKNEHPCLNRHSSSSGAILSTCSSPSSQRKAFLQRGTGMLRRSRTLHHRPVQMDQRRRASHPASPNYSSLTLAHYARSFQQDPTEEAVMDALYNANYTTHHANQHTHHANHAPHHVNYPLHHPNHHTRHAIYHGNYPNHPIHTVHHANHPTHINNQPTHHSNHLVHPENYITHHANHPTNHQAHHGGYVTNSNHMTLPTQHSLPNHATFVRNTNATLPAQHSHQPRHVRPMHAMSQPSLSSSFEDHHFSPAQNTYHRDNWEGSLLTEPPKDKQQDKITLSKTELERGQERTREARFHTLAHTPSQSQDGNDTWPKPTNRHGLYSTLEGHVATTPVQKSASNAVNSRAVRNQLLRERALQLADERSGGMSTDDEANVEIRRTGRYWSRSERREHMLQKQRQRREVQEAEANSNTGLRAVASGEGGYSALMELSQRKLSRLRHRKLLDDWTTVEELLTHGTRLGPQDEAISVPNSLLTVTTV